jgi:hypothetical protein
LALSVRKNRQDGISFELNDLVIHIDCQFVGPRRREAWKCLCLLVSDPWPESCHWGVSNVRARPANGGGADRKANMLWTIAVVLLVLWGLGLVTSYTVGGYVHILLVLAVIAVAIRLIQGRKLL